MKTLFGRPLVEVPQPSGALVGYVVEGVTPSDPRVSREWRLTSPKGETHTVSEYPSYWRCTCLAFTRYTRHGRRHTLPTGAVVCKHVATLAEMIGAGHAAEIIGRSGEGLAGHARPDAPAAPVGEHDPP